MREIKFRAWDKERGVMLSTDTDNWSVGKTEWYENEELMMLSGIEDMAKMEQYVLMQYTGLKDKNGKEIFEGDIVQDENGMDAKVYFAEGVAQFRLCFYNIDHFEDMYDMESTEVIGNIYENPELLKEVK
jgi:uncharacterized phage protein (TIGR01671 family)